jgi:serine/threonine protein kinase
MKNQFIIKMHYAFQTPSYSEGGDLSMHIEERQIFDESETKFYIAELILAIEYLHSNNIIYHDLKPENILLGKDGHIKLSDFGLAKQMYGQDPSPALTFCGNSAYLSPEMLLKKGANKPLDVHGIGTILYELLVGFAPYYDEY